METSAPKHKHQPPSLSKSPATPPAAPPAVSAGLTEEAETRICKRVRRQGQRTSQPISRAPPSQHGQGSHANRHPTAQELQDTQRPRGGSTQPHQRGIILRSVFSPIASPIAVCLGDPRWILLPNSPSAGSEHTSSLSRRFYFIFFIFDFLNDPRQTTLHHRPRSTVDQFALSFTDRPAGRVERWTRPSENGAPLYPRWNSQADFGREVGRA
jgi:hypothetical protein